MRSPTVQETRYETGALLGRGGMADVYAGTDCHLGRPVAIKRLREERAADPTVRARFRQEASAAAKLNHPGIVAIFDAAEMEPSPEAAPVPIIVMELVDGCTLRETFRDTTTLTTDRALEITAAILTRWPRATGLASSTETSSRRMFWSRLPARSRSPTLASPARCRTTRPPRPRPRS